MYIIVGEIFELLTSRDFYPFTNHLRKLGKKNKNFRMHQELTANLP